MISTQQKEDILNFLSFFFDRKVNICFCFQIGHQIFISNNNREEIVFPVEEVLAHTHLSDKYSKVEISKKRTFNCWNVIQYIVENGLYFKLYLSKKPKIFIWNRYSIDYHINIYDDYFLTKENSFVNKNKFQKINSLEVLTKYIKNNIIDE